MQLKLTRSQRTGGIMGSTAYFILDARAYLTPAEQANVTRYKLGSMCIYNSEASKKHLATAAGNMATGNAMGSIKALGSLALAAMKLNITIDGLCRGTHVECKDMDELIGAEAAVKSACENLREYLDQAETFDGREVLYEYSGAESVVVAPSRASLAPPRPAPATPMIEARVTEMPPPIVAPAIAGAAPAAAMMMADRSHHDEAPPIDKFQEWWGGLTGGQKLGMVAAVIAGLYIFSIIF